MIRTPQHAKTRFQQTSGNFLDVHPQLMLPGDCLLERASGALEDKLTEFQMVTLLISRGEGSKCALVKLPQPPGRFRDGRAGEEIRLSTAWETACETERLCHGESFHLNLRTQSCRWGTRTIGATMAACSLWSLEGIPRVCPEATHTIRARIQSLHAGWAG